MACERRFTALPQSCHELDPVDQCRIVGAREVSSAQSARKYRI